MALYYQLPCSCGHTVSVEASQAGEQVSCVCGKTLNVPSLLKLKQLPTIGADETEKSTERSINPRQILLMTGLLLLAGTIAFSIYVIRERPSARKVLEKPVGKILDGRVRPYNSTPISEEEFLVLAVDPEYVLFMSPMQAHQYFDVLGPELQMGFNFQENYQVLKDAHTLRLVVLAILSVITLAVLVIVPFVPTSLQPPEPVGARPSRR